MIADSWKRIEQHQQLMNTNFDNASHTDPLSSSLDFALDRLLQRLECALAEIERHEKVAGVLEKVRNDPALRGSPKSLRIKLKSEPNRDLVLRDLIAGGKGYKNEAMLQQAALEDILREAEKRATKV